LNRIEERWKEWDKLRKDPDWRNKVKVEPWMLPYLEAFKALCKLPRPKW